MHPAPRVNKPLVTKVPLFVKEALNSLFSFSVSFAPLATVMGFVAIKASSTTMSSVTVILEYALFFIAATNSAPAATRAETGPLSPPPELDPPLGFVSSGFADSVVVSLTLFSSCCFKVAESELMLMSFLFAASILLILADASAFNTVFAPLSALIVSTFAVLPRLIFASACALELSADTVISATVPSMLTVASDGTLIVPILAFSPVLSSAEAALALTTVFATVPDSTLTLA